MKNLLCIITLSTLVLTSCGSTNKMEHKTTEETQENMDSSYEIGKVHLNQGECEIFIITEGENPNKLYPVDLDEMFRVNNAILQFEFSLSRAPLPEGCEDCRAAVLRNVTRVKR